MIVSVKAMADRKKNAKRALLYLRYAFNLQKNELYVLFSSATFYVMVKPFTIIHDYTNMLDMKHGILTLARKVAIASLIIS